MKLGNNLVMDDCDPPFFRLPQEDSWMDQAKQRQENGERGEWRVRGKTWYSENGSNFSSALRPSGGAPGNNKLLLQPLSLFPRYREVKSSKNSVTAFLCMCVSGAQRRQTTCIMTSINLHTLEGWWKRLTTHLLWLKCHLLKDFFLMVSIFWSYLEPLHL